MPFDPVAFRDRLELAIKNTPLNHIVKTFAMRNKGPEQTGSYFEHSISPEELLTAAWRPYSHPNVLEGCEAFISDIPGFLGVVPLRDLDPKKPVKLVDKKGTVGTYGGGVVPEVSSSDGWTAPAVDFTVIILGMDEVPGRGKLEMLFTVHPGDPIPASEKDDPSLLDKLTTVADAIALGFEYAKVAKSS